MQCCVWSCSNRKGRYPLDVHGALVCERSEMRLTGCPKSAEIITLHNIARMPDDIKKTTIARINLTRSVENGKKWEPTGDCFIYKLHYEDFIGPSRKTPNRIPEYFARPSSSAPAKKKRRVLQRANQEQDSPMDDSVAGEEGTQPQSLSHLEEMDSADTPGCINGGESSTLDGDTRIKQLTLMNASLQKCNELLQQELKALLTQLQRLDVRLLNNSELHMYTGLNCTAFNILLKWL